MKYCKWCGAEIEDNIIICPHCKANQNANNTNAGNTANQNSMSPNMINAIYQMTQDIRAMRRDIKFIKDFYFLISIPLIIYIVGLFINYLIAP